MLTAAAVKYNLYTVYGVTLVVFPLKNVWLINDLIKCIVASLKKIIFIDKHNFVELCWHNNVLSYINLILSVI